MTQLSSPAAPPPLAADRWLGEFQAELHHLDAEHLRRRLVTMESLDGPVARVQGRDVVCWCSNDYLGLAAHPRLAEAAADAARHWGVGARASRLLAGTTRWHTQLEQQLAAWFGADDAIVFASGYLANLGALGALLSPEDLVVADRLVHASLLDAARHSGATVRVFRHNDPTHAAEILGRARAGARRRLLVTEGVFSMDGDRAPLGALLEAAEAHDAMVYLDDAHGAFVAGAAGRGSPEAAGIAHERFIYMGTLGKALGAQGGFIVGAQVLMDYLRNRARTFIYATALAIPVAAAACEALRVMEDEPQRRSALQAKALRLCQRLPRPWTPASASHIVPIVVGDAKRALALADRLWEQGIWTPAIRPPTVPRGTARLRVSLTAAHTDAQVDDLARALHADA